MSVSLQEAVASDGKEYFSQDPNHASDFEHSLKEIMAYYSNENIATGFRSLNTLQNNIFVCHLRRELRITGSVDETTISQIPRDQLAELFLKMPISIFNKFSSSIVL